MNDRSHPGRFSRVELHCAVSGCPWTHRRTDPDPRLATLRSVSPPDLDFNAAFDAATRQDDDACRAHIATHPIEDFLRTIADLQAQLATAQDEHRGLLPT